MKNIEAIIREDRLDAVRRALEEVGINGMTITEVFGRGQQRGAGAQISSKRANFIPKLRLDVVCHDQDYQIAVQAIIRAARTGKIGDGKIFIWNVDEAIRIRTGETGEPVV